MKKIIVFLAVIIAIPCLADGLSKKLNIEAAEIYVCLYPGDGYLHIKEYRLSAVTRDTSTEKIKSLIEDAKFCEKRFPFRHFTAMEESMKRDRGYITGEYHLMTRERSLVKMMEDSFGKILDRKVKVTINEDDIGLHFIGPDIQVRSNNANGVYGKEDQRVIFWKNGLQYFEVVFGEHTDQHFDSIAASFGADVSSPEKTEADVAAWKNKKSLFENMDEKYQHDADIFRLRHLKYFGELIAEYHRKTGKYPLQGKSAHQNYVYIAAPHQQKYVKAGPPHKHEVTDVEAFREELEKGLGRKTDLKFDPQKVPVGGPNFYIYMIEGDSFFFAVHLYNDHSFTNPVSNHYHKIEITNKDFNRRGVWKYKILLADKAFQKAIGEKPYKEGFFLHLEEQYK